MKLRFTVLALGISTFLASTAIAQQEQKACGKSAAHAKAGARFCPKAAKGKDGCDPAKCAAACPSLAGGTSKVKMPMMMYKVGDQQFCCEKEAVKLAKGDDAAIQFVVGEKTYTDRTEALKAHAQALDKFLCKVTTVKYVVGDECATTLEDAEALAKKTGAEIRYCLAFHKFDARAAAEEAAKAAKAAAEKISIKWAVGDEAFECPASAQQAADAAGKKLEYCVGKTKTSCKVTAQVALARARIHAAVAAIAKAAEDKSQPA